MRPQALHPPLAAAQPSLPSGRVGDGGARTVKGRVVHLLRDYGHVSESFLVDNMLALDRVGWEGWVVASTIVRRDLYSFPPPERLLGARPAGRARRAVDLLALRSSAERRAAGLGVQIAAARPDLVHAHFGWAAADARLAARRLALPLVVTFRGTDLTVWPGYRRFYRDYRKLFREMDRAIAISQFLADKLRGYGYDRRIEVVPTGISLQDFPFRGCPVEREVTRLLYVGRQVPCKGIDVLLRAFSALSAGRSDLRLDIVGDGPERSANEALATELGVARLVTFLGAQPRPRVLEALWGADIFVMPSKTMATGQAEGLGNVTKEALAVGVPVVASATGGIPETIPPEHRHELVPENDPRELARRILDLLDRREQWPERVVAGREWVEREFDWRRLAGRIAAIYEEVLDERGARRAGAGVPAVRARRHEVSP